MVHTLQDLSKKSILRNHLSESPRHQLENIPDDASVFTTLDLKDSFWQIRLKKSCRLLTAVRAPDGRSYELSRLPQGHKNSSYNLMKCFEVVLAEEIATLNLLFYYDDILVYAKDESHMAEKLNILLPSLEAKGFTLNGSKCEFSCKTVTWAGFEVSQNSIAIPQKYLNRLDDLADYVPKTGKDCARVFGVLSYIRNFTDQFSALTAPIVSAMTSEQDVGHFVWNEKEQTALRDIISKLKDSCRVYKIRYGPEYPLFIFTDASNFAISAVIFQKDENDNYRLIDCASRRLNKTERNYSIFRKEAVAIALSGEKFRNYIIDPTTPKHWNCDSRSLYLLSKNANTNSTFSLFLDSLQSIFQPATLNFIDGTANKWADFFSRLPAYKPNGASSQKDEFVNIFCKKKEFHNPDSTMIDKFDHKDNSPQQKKLVRMVRALWRKEEPMRVRPVTTRSQNKRQGSKITEHIDEISPVNKKNTTHENNKDTQKDKDKHITSTNIINNQKEFTTDQPANTDGDSSNSSKEFYRPDTDMQKPLYTRNELKEFSRRIIEVNAKEDGKRQAEIAHKRLHIQSKELSNLFGLSKKVADSVVASCNSCAKHPSPQAHLQEKMGFRRANQPNKRIFVDVFQFNSKSNISLYLLAVDEYSEVISVRPIRNQRTGTVLNALFQIFTEKGVAPEFLVTDGAPSFRTKAFIEELAKCGTILENSSAYRSNANKAERYIRTCKSYLRRAGRSDPASAKALYLLNLELNLLRSNTKGSPPIQMERKYTINKKRAIGLEMPEFNEPPSIYYDEIERQKELESIKIHNDKLEKKANKAKIKIDKKFKVGDSIRFKKFGKKGADSLAGIITKIDGMDIVIQSEKGSTVIRHVEDIIGKVNNPVSNKDKASVRTINAKINQRSTSSPSKDNNKAQSQKNISAINRNKNKNIERPRFKPQAEQKSSSYSNYTYQTKNRYTRRK